MHMQAYLLLVFLYFTLVTAWTSSHAKLSIYWMKYVFVLYIGRELKIYGTATRRLSQFKTKTFLQNTTTMNNLWTQEYAQHNVQLSIIPSIEQQAGPSLER